MLPVARLGLSLIVPVSVLALSSLTGTRSGRPSKPMSWDPKIAATYLDARTKAWTSGGAMDHGTFCVSCHTALTYGLARPVMRSELGENQASSVERQLLESVTKRVQLWDQVQPYLGDKNGGPGTESVLNALVLSREDALSGHLTETTKQALRIMWSQQTKMGERAGAWPWHNFGNEPWEAPDSVYWGATLAAVTTGTAPDGYLSTPTIQTDFELLKAYLRKGIDDKSLFNRVGLLWASTKIPDLITKEQKATIVSDVVSKQRADGGWSTASLIPPSWTRHDKTPQESRSDGYGTGLVAYVLEQAGTRRTSRELQRALSWLAQNQDRITGSWPTVSPNITRDASTDSGKFMTDAATAYAVLALSNSH